MHAHDLSLWAHGHDYGTAAERRAERRTRAVVTLTLAMMVIELVAGWLTGSMALLADGWHMGSHAAALGVAAYAYHFAHRHRADPRFSFGTGKVSSLAGYSSALLVGHWALGLARSSAQVLLDAGDHGAIEQRVRSVIEGDADNQVADLHLWRIGPRGLRVHRLPGHPPAPPGGALPNPARPRFGPHPCHRRGEPLP